MIEKQPRLSWHLIQRALLIFAMLFGVVGHASQGHAADREDGFTSLTDAGEQGALSVGAARAAVDRRLDPASGRGVLKLDYAVAQGTGAGVWAKAFPHGLGPERADVVRVDVRPADPGQTEQIAVTVEIKGRAGTQRVPVDLRAGGPLEEGLNWATIGAVEEVVVLVNTAGTGQAAEGTVYLDIGFERLSWWRKLSMLVEARMGGVLLVSVLAGSMLGGLHWLTGGRRRRPTSLGREIAWQVQASEATWWSRRARDLVYGAGIVFVAGLGIGIDWLGQASRLEVGWSALGAAIAGVAIAEWLKYGLTGKHLTAGEAFRDALATGMLGASASSLSILQTPSTWSEMLMLSRPVAAGAAVFYHALNAYRLASSGKHLGTIGGVLVVAPPYVVGGLLLLGSGPLLAHLGAVLLAGKLAAWPSVLETVGRVLVVFAFNEAVAMGLALATNRCGLRSIKAHLGLLAVAMAAVAAPWVADLGSGSVVASLPAVVRAVAMVLATMISQAGLWAEVYLVTGMVLGALGGKAPSPESIVGQPLEGARKGMVFSGTLMLVLCAIGLVWSWPVVRSLAGQHPLLVAMCLGALAFPLAKTVMESFDGSRGFLRRLGQSYRRPTLYARGVVVGLGLAYAIVHGLAAQEMASRVWFGLGVGIAAFAGVNLVRDIASALRGRGRVPSWRVYLVASVAGGFLGAAIGFYLDAAQVAIVASKFHRYLGAGLAPEAYGVYPLLSKWGFISLGSVTGGVNLLFAEALAGVISWSVPAWLFAINRTLMAAYFRKEATPIKALFTRGGLAELTKNMLEVLRWGLWMSPIINSFLRPVGDPTWYNQDGAIRTLVAVFYDTMSPETFRAWSLQVFVYLLAYDAVRILIWLDHMGLRVATLVNLSFLGMDRLEARLARFLGSDATARCIPEGVKRFTTWAPLLIPFYIPRGAEWDMAWSQAEALRNADQGSGLVAAMAGLPWAEQLLLVAAAIGASTAACSLVGWIGRRVRSRRGLSWSLGNAEYEVVLKDSGAVFSWTRQQGYDVTRRSYDLLDPAGRALFLVDKSASPEVDERAWPVVGNYPTDRYEASRMERGEDCLRIHNESNAVRTTIEISLPGPGDPVEQWTITLQNRSDAARQLMLVPYLEWVLNRPDADRGHTQYNRLFAEMEYVGELRAVLAWDKHSKAMGILACDAAPQGFLTSRIDFIGRARSVWTPRALETLCFAEAHDTPPHPTFDPIGSLLVSVNLEANGSAQVRLLIGLAKDKQQATNLIARHLGTASAQNAGASGERKTSHRIGHGEIPPGTPQPYYEYADNGRTLLVRTPLTPRPYDHTMSNALGHVVVVTNRGLHTTSNGNSQQNRLTPDWPDIVTREVPAEAFYLYDPDRREWYSPTYHPLNDSGAGHEVEFGVDGTATYRMRRGTLATELTVFVPPEEPTGVYLLRVKNHAEVARRLRLAPYFQMVLADQPEHSGPLVVRRNKALSALWFENPRNGFRRGTAFVAMSCSAQQMVTRRGQFFGPDRNVACPYLVEHGKPSATTGEDDRPIAAFLGTLDIPAHGECTVAVVLGQADDPRQAEAIVRKYRDLEAVRASLKSTRKWWLSLMDTVRVETSNRALDHYLDWLKYQALAERIWARRGFYQASGAFGFRDQLQDSVNLMWVDPWLARQQILLHASQQFLEGDVVHWFHLLQDGRTGFAARTHASDNPLWLAWAVAEYVAATGDVSILDERTPYLEAEQPLEPLPAGKEGMGFDPLRSSRVDTVYRHCMKAIDRVLDRRTGAHGLPLMGAGDWNDGLDEIGSQGRGESVWLGFFLYYILDRMAGIIAEKDGQAWQHHYRKKAEQLKEALEATWRGDRYLRAIHDDGTEIGVEGSGVWEIDALTAAWAVMSGIHPQRGRTVLDTALRVLEKERTILLGWPALSEDTKPYLGRSSRYPEGVRENGMYCHGVQWLVGAARIVAEQCRRDGQLEAARCYRQTAYRLWLKISPIPHTLPEEIERYGGQPNKQAADMVTTFDPGRMIWHGYTGAAAWLFRQALEGVLGMRLVCNEVVTPEELGAAGGPWSDSGIFRDLEGSPFQGRSKPRQIGCGGYRHHGRAGSRRRAGDVQSRPYG